MVHFTKGSRHSVVRHEEIHENKCKILQLEAVKTACILSLVTSRLTDDGLYSVE